MEIVFRNTRTGRELAMPVTPPEFAVEAGRHVAGLDMAQTGQVNLPGLDALFNERLEFLLPAGRRNYTSGGYEGDPYAIVDTLASWSSAGDVLRFIVTESPVNFPVLLEPVRYGERDGTGDVYLTLTLRQYRELEEAAAEVSPETGNKARPARRTEQAERTCTVEKGDTLWGIARKRYGDGTLCWKLAAYNGIQNANLIYPGQVVTIPDKSKL